MREMLSPTAAIMGKGNYFLELMDHGLPVRQGGGTSVDVVTVEGDVDRPGGRRHRVEVAEQRGQTCRQLHPPAADAHQDEIV